MEAPDDWVKFYETDTTLIDCARFYFLPPASPGVKLLFRTGRSGSWLLFESYGDQLKMQNSSFLCAVSIIWIYGASLHGPIIYLFRFYRETVGKIGGGGHFFTGGLNDHYWPPVNVTWNVLSAVRDMQTPIIMSLFVISVAVIIRIIWTVR